MINVIFVGLLFTVLLCVIYFIYRPLKSIHPKANESNIAINKSKMRELKREVRNQTLKESDLDFYEEEVIKNLAGELDNLHRPSHVFSTPMAIKHKLSVIVVISATLLSFLIYAQVEHKEPVNIDINNIAAIKEVIKDNPQNITALHMLGVAYNIAGNLSKARDAYQRVYEVALANNSLNVHILTEYASVLATLNNGYEGLPSELVKKARMLYPNSPKAFYLEGVIAANNADFVLAKTIWNKALSLSEEGSSNYELLTTVLKELEPFLSEANNAVIEVIIDIDESIYKEFFQGYVMVFARSADSPIPVAISRIPLNEFIGHVSLSNENSIMPTNTLSQFDTVNIVVRLSKTGQAIKQPEDIELSQQGVKVKTQTVNFSIK